MEIVSSRITSSPDAILRALIMASVWVMSEFWLSSSSGTPKPNSLEFLPRKVRNHCGRLASYQYGISRSRTQVTVGVSIAPPAHIWARCLWGPKIYVKRYSAPKAGNSLRHDMLRQHTSLDRFSGDRFTDSTQRSFGAEFMYLGAFMVSHLV